MTAHDSAVPTVAMEGPPPRSSGRLRVEGGELYYEVTGRGPVIVFAHGLGGNHMSWWQQVSHFQRTHTCVTFAHRGFFPSSLDAGQPDPRRYAEDLKVLLDHLLIERAHLVGQSMGGWTVIEYCVRHPARVSSVVLSATTGSIDPGRMSSLDASEFARWKSDSENSAQSIRSAGIHPAAGARMAREQPSLHLLYQQIDGLSRHLDKEVVRAGLYGLRVREPAELAATAVPVLLISPDEDIVIAPPALRALARELPGATLAALPATGHSPYFERAPDFNRCLDEFFAKIR